MLGVIDIKLPLLDMYRVLKIR